MRKLFPDIFQHLGFRILILFNTALLLSKLRAAGVLLSWGKHPQALCDLGSVFFLLGKTRPWNCGHVTVPK